MTRPDSVRKSICHLLALLGASPDSSVRETLLIRDGVYCGHRFLRDGLEAIWFVEENQIKVFDRNGALADCLESAELMARLAREPATRFAA